MPHKTLVGTCVQLPARAITSMVDNAREISLSTFRRHVDANERRDIEAGLGYAVGHQRGLHLKDDGHVSYGKSVYQGKPCVFMAHSAIEWVFV